MPRHAALDEVARGFLARRRLAHFATADATGAPHVIPVCFALLEDTAYIAIDEKPKRGDIRHLRRLRNIAENPRVAIVADVYDDADWSRLGFVLLRGRARLVPENSPEHASALATLRDKYRQYRAMTLENRPLIAAEVESVTTWGRLDT